MEQLHAHEVLHMMEGNSYTELSLREAIIQKFGVFSPALPTIWM